MTTTATYTKNLTVPLSGTICKSFSCVKKGVKKKVSQARSALANVREASLQVFQIVPYGAYYVAYTTLDQAKQHGVPLPGLLRASLVSTEAAGLAGNAAINVLRGKSSFDDSQDDSVLPNFIARRWNPSWLIWHLPGGSTDKEGKRSIDFRW